MPGWSVIGDVRDFPLQGAKVIETERGPIAIFRTDLEEFYAIDDRCPHHDGPLSDGPIANRRVTCPFHQWVIDLATGEVVSPGRGRVACYAVKVTAGKVLLQKELE
jgi:nitrite reductase (NADH) small subunit